VPAGTYLDAVLGLGDSMTYMSEGVTHTIRVSGFFDDVVELEIQSPVKIKETLKVGETKLFDLNENGLVDLELKLLSKVNDTIKLRIKPLFEVALPPPAPAIVPGAPPTPAAVSVCGNNVCEAGESSANCITDCPMSYTAAFFAGTGSLTNFIIVLLVAVLIYVGWRELEHGHIKLKRKPKPKPRPLCPTSRREKEEDTWKH
jgi:hypothetical protein